MKWLFFFFLFTGVLINASLVLADDLFFTGGAKDIFPLSELEKLEEKLNFSPDEKSNDQSAIGTPLSDDQKRLNVSRSYQDMCFGSPKKGLSRSQNVLFCECSAQKMQSLFTLQEIQNLKLDTKTGEKERDKFAAVAFVPCMIKAYENVVEDECLREDKNTMPLKHQRKFCECYKDYLGESAMRISMPQYLMYRGAGYTKFTQPENFLYFLLDNRVMQNHARKHMRDCFNEIERGLTPRDGPRRSR